jgi:hypothetical protein
VAVRNALRAAGVSLQNNRVLYIIASTHPMMNA